MSDAPPHEENLGIGKPVRRNVKRVEYYAEENFAGADLRRYVHIGWGVTLGALGILGCMCMSAATQGKSFNVGFQWLQRRVGFQFGTLTYLITTMALYYHDGDKWVTRDWAELVQRFGPKGAKAQALPSMVTLPEAANAAGQAPLALSHGFAASGALTAQGSK